MSHADTIVALSTPIGSGLRAIVRVSGSRSFELFAPLLGGRSVEFVAGRVTRLSVELSQGIRFDVTAYAFRSPRSATGEDVLEIHLPASPFLVSALLERLILLGARQAEPGEFTARAFFNGKLDLTAAEGVAATISSTNRAELDAARQMLGGELSRRLRPILDDLVSILALVEVGIDFTDEDVTFLPAAALRQRVGQAQDSLQRLLNESPRIERLSHEPRIVLAGRPNAGKSTLLNALAGTARAVVSDVAGTTRDALSAHVSLKRGRVKLVDVAGLDEASDDAIEKRMQAVAATEIETADAVVLVIDPFDLRPRLRLTREPDLVVYSKADLALPPKDGLGVDAPHGIGLERLRERLDQLAFGSLSGATVSLALNARHVNSIKNASDSLARALDAIDGGGELVASELRTAINHLGSILGTVSADDVLGKIFSSFCIGK